MEITDSEKKEFLDSHLGKTKYRLAPVKKGGSDRSFYRLLLPDQSSFILMLYGTETEENNYWSDINGFLAGLGILVPKIHAEDRLKRLLLMEDLGDADLCSLSGLPWSERRNYYFQALAQIRRLHSFPLPEVPANLKIARKYDRSLYLWEQNYFRENFVSAICHLEMTSSFARELERELSGLVGFMMKTEPSLIHRDFQSQNIMIKNDRPVLIDFQGLREGSLYYDLGSLICDPYVKFADEERNELIFFYYQLLKPPCGIHEFTFSFWMAATQRLMQALGAYGFLGLKKGKPDFLRHIRGGISNLQKAAEKTSALPVLQALADKCSKNLPAINNGFSSL